MTGSTAHHVWLFKGVQPFEAARSWTFPASPETPFAPVRPSAPGWCSGIGPQLKATETSKKFGQRALWLLAARGAFLEEHQSIPWRVNLIFAHCGLCFLLSWNPPPSSSQIFLPFQKVSMQYANFVVILLQGWALSHGKPAPATTDCCGRLQPLS